MSTSHAKEIKAGALWFEDRAATDGANFYAGHRDADLEVAVRAVVC